MKVVQVIGVVEVEEMVQVLSGVDVVEHLWVSQLNQSAMFEHQDAVGFHHSGQSG